LILREYQLSALDKLRASYGSGRRAPVCVAPTGAGKTIIGSEIVRLSVSRGRRVLFNAHREELIQQTANKLAEAGITNIRTIRAARDIGSNSAPVSVASIQTLTRWDGERMPDADLVVFDECHHCVSAAPTWKRIADNYRDSLLLGLTATPQRADGSPLGDVFDDLIVVASVRELTELGHLVPCRVWAPPKILETGQLAVSPVDAYVQRGEDQRAIVFCVTKEHAAQVTAEFNARGILSAVLHGQLSKSMRAQILAWFREGQIRVLCNVHVLTEGFDDPGCAVCILCRKPEHVGTFLQMVGRILRPAPGKTGCILLDLCGSSLVHGTPEMERAYSLDGKPISSVERESIRQCPTCGGVFLTTSMEDGACPQCGVEMPKPERKIPRSVDAGLVEAKAIDQLRLNLEAVARRNRRSPEWVKRAHAAIMGRKVA
jgi:DNA repair protein RadD